MLFEEGFTQNRELSWLRYEERILEEALDERVPLFERLRFIDIFTRNLEEFFKVRVGSLLDEDEEGTGEPDKRSGLTAADQLRIIHSMVPGLLIKKDMALSTVERGLAEAGIKRLEPEYLRDVERGRCFDFFREEIRDRISVSIIRSDEEIPWIDEERPYMIAELDAELEDRFGLIDIPADLPKLYILDSGKSFRYVLTEDIIAMVADTLFIPFIPVELHTVDIARNASLQNRARANTADDMRALVSRETNAPADKLIADGKLSKNLEAFLCDKLGLDARQIFTTTRIDLSYINELAEAIPADILGMLTYEPNIPHDQTRDIEGSIIDRALEEDILSAYPFDSMDVFLGLLREASFREDVKERRITIYGLSSHPKIAEYLIYAARNGKKVRVVLELRARFDEERNLVWADRLSSAGCKVYYGTDRYKVHSKLCQIVLEGDEKRYITQVSTGNYNEKTAKQYTDLSLITGDKKIGRAASRLFRDICREELELSDKDRSGRDTTGRRYLPLLAAPVNMRSELIRLIEKEASKGEDGLIFIKVNSLTDQKIMEALMEASCRGCRVRLVVRGACCLLPGIRGCTENICIVNMVGRFLEHSRVYVFGEGKRELMYISSADLMERNMDKRVEAACPVNDRKIKNRIRGLMQDVYCDTEQGRVMLPDGTFAKKPE